MGLALLSVSELVANDSFSGFKAGSLVSSKQILSCVAFALVVNAAS